MNEHDNAYVDAMHMVNMQANTRSVTQTLFLHCELILSMFQTFSSNGPKITFVTCKIHYNQLCFRGH